MAYLDDDSFLLSAGQQARRELERDGWLTCDGCGDVAPGARMRRTADGRWLCTPPPGAAVNAGPGCYAIYRDRLDEAAAADTVETDEERSARLMRAVVASGYRDGVETGLEAFGFAEAAEPGSDGQKAA